LDTDTFNILIADRNRYIRELVEREMAAEGYQVFLARSGRDALKRIFSGENIHLIILDPDLPDSEEFPLLETFREYVLPIIVVVHTLFPYHIRKKFEECVRVVVEKKEDSIDELKKVVIEIANKIKSE
jgi:CheY-like chemotaxis protein